MSQQDAHVDVCDEMAAGAVHRGLLDPMKYRAYRAIWLANLFANLGMWAQSVASAWVVTEQHGSPLMVAMIQVASALPLVLLSIVAGVLADNHDRRKLMLVGMVIQTAGGVFITVIAEVATLTPELLILSILGISLGSALITPAWQAAVNEQVPRSAVAGAVLLNSVNFNVARAVGPALGGIMLGFCAPKWVFLLNSLCSLVLMYAIWRWHREVPARSLPPERIREGVKAALQFTHYSTVTRIVMLRSFLFGICASAIWALLPLLADQNPEGSAVLYGYMLGTLGIGAIFGSVGIDRLRRRMGTGRMISLASGVCAAMLLILGSTHNLWCVFIALLLSGSCWIAALSTYNASVQLLVPDWVKGRALALYQTSLYGGLALGSFLWGHLASTMTVLGALQAAGIVMLVCAVLLYHSKLPSLDDNDMLHVDGPAHIAPAIAFNPQRGSVMVTVDYRIPEARTHEFIRAMRRQRKLRLRNGAERWWLYRDTQERALWQEVFLVRNWLQHLRMQDRMTIADKHILDTVLAFHGDSEPPRVRYSVSYKSMRASDSSLPSLAEEPASVETPPEGAQGSPHQDDVIDSV